MGIVKKVQDDGKTDDTSRPGTKRTTPKRHFNRVEKTPELDPLMSISEDESLA